MQVPSSTAPSTSTLTGSSSSSAALGGNTQSFQSVLGQLNSYLKETPAQRMEASILASLGITPQQLASMSPADREKVMEKVKELMKKEMTAQEQQQQQQTQQKVQELTATTQSSGTSGKMSSNTSANHKKIDIAI